MAKPRKGDRQDHASKSMFKSEKDFVAFYESPLEERRKRLGIEETEGED